MQINVSVKCAHMKSSFDITVLDRKLQVAIFCHLADTLQLAHDCTDGTLWEGKTADVQSMLAMDCYLMKDSESPDPPTSTSRASGSSESQASSHHPHPPAAACWPEAERSPLQDRRRYERMRRVKDVKLLTSVAIMPRLSESGSRESGTREGYSEEFRGDERRVLLGSGLDDFEDFRRAVSDPGNDECSADFRRAVAEPGIDERSADFRRAVSEPGNDEGSATPSPSVRSQPDMSSFCRAPDPECAEGDRHLVAGWWRSLGSWRRKALLLPELKKPDPPPERRRVRTS